MERWKRQPKDDEKPSKCVLTRLGQQHLVSVQDETSLYESPHYYDRNYTDKANSLLSDFAQQEEAKKRTAVSRDHSIPQAFSTTALGAGSTDLLIH